MEPTRVPRVKICCISSIAEARMAIELGASALGLVSAMPSGPGVIGEEQIAEIAATIPPPIASFLLTSQQSVEAIVAQQRRCRTNCIQLCDSVTSGSLHDLKAALPGVSIIQVIHVTGPESVDEAVAVAASVDAILLDSGNPSLAVKELGGIDILINNAGVLALGPIDDFKLADFDRTTKSSTTLSGHGSSRSAMPSATTAKNAQASVLRCG
jgi:phosphoribosylanthranilate isomerase